MDLNATIVKTRALNGTIIRAAGGGGTSDYDALTNRPQINGVTLTGDLSSTDLGLADAADIPAAGTATPKALGTAAVGTSLKYAREDHVHAKPTIPTAASSGTPAMDGTASRGSSANFARADHVHPTDTSRAAASDLANKADKITEVTNSSAGAVSVALDPEKIYHFTGALTSITPTLTSPSSGQLAHYHFDFNSGSTAPTLTLPQTVTMPSGFTVEASKHYEIDILNNYGAVMAW